MRDHRSSIPISKREITHLLNAAGVNFREYIQTLNSIYRGEIHSKTGENIIRFQISLLNSLLPLEDYYHNIIFEQKRLINSKSRLNVIWFGRRMSSLARYRKLILDALAIGRAIGDGFAWIFYERDKQLISEHLKVQRQIFFPPGIGGLGEKLTLENMQGLGGQMLLYHGLTTFLRLGDASLINLESMRVGAVVELKSHRTNKTEINVTMTVLPLPPQNVPMIENISTDFHIPSSLPEKIRKKRERQIKNMINTLHRIEVNKFHHKITSDSEFYFDTLEQVITESGHSGLSIKKAGDGLLLAAVSLGRYRKLSAVLETSEPRHLPRLMSELPGKVMEILDEKLPHNSIILDWLAEKGSDLALREGRLPIATWPIGAAPLTKLLFGEVIVMTIYNPAHFWQRLRQKGFTVDLSDDGRFQTAQKNLNGKLVELGNMEFFLQLISQALISEESVIRMLDDALDHSHNLTKNGTIKIELQPILGLGLLGR